MTRERSQSPTGAVSEGATEATPLLSHEAAALRTSESNSSLGETLYGKPTPLPWRSLSVLALLRLCDPVCFYVVFPFIPSMIRDLHIVDSDERVGYLAGIIESAFALTQFATILLWSRLSDYYGRKPILLAGAFGSAISVFGMGVSTSFAGLIFSRCICGFFSGSTGVMKAAIGEITDPSNRARALTVSPLMAGVGASLGPMIGAIRINSSLPFFQQHPYLAPCAAAGLVPSVSFVVALFFLPETLQKHDYEGSDPHSPAQKGPKPFKELLTGQILAILTNYSMLVFVSTAFLAITPVLCFTKPSQGGLGFDPSATGSLLAFRGVMTIFIQSVFFPILDRKIGSARLFRLVSLVFPFLFFTSPLLVLLAKAQHRWATGAAFAFDMVLWATGNMAYSCGTMLVVSAAPSGQDLGSLNGMVQFSAAGVRAFSPASATALYALSVDKHALGGQLWWALLGAISLLTVPLASLLRQPQDRQSKGV